MLRNLTSLWTFSVYLRFDVNLLQCYTCIWHNISLLLIVACEVLGSRSETKNARDMLQLELEDWEPKRQTIGGYVDSMKTTVWHNNLLIWCEILSKQTHKIGLDMLTIKCRVSNISLLPRFFFSRSKKVERACSAEEWTKQSTTTKHIRSLVWKQCKTYLQ